MVGHRERFSSAHTSIRRACGALLVVVLAALPLEGVVLSEIHYNPPLGQEGLEFLEITNDAFTPEDISGWAFVEGIGFEFPPGSILEGKESLVVCADVDALRAQYGIQNAVGNYEGKLDGSGERITLVNHVGIVVQSLRYRTEGKWPVAPDGTGHSLVLRSLNLDTSEPESWTQSQQLGGNPGQHEATTVGDTETLFFNELFRGAAAGGGWVELYHAGSGLRDISGWSLTDDPDRENSYVFPEGTTLPAGGFLVVEELTGALTLSAPRVQLFLMNPQGLVEAAVTFDRTPPDGLALGDYSEALFPDGGSPPGYEELWVTPITTPGSGNDVPRVTDLVINEIFYHPPEDRAGEFLELFNRGTEGLDLSGFRFTKGIGYTFPAGVSLAPGAYLVLADDPQIIEERHGLSGALRWSSGTLSNGGENLRLEDRLGNRVDEVRYFDGGEWSLWADGRGSSLELIDPHQDNDFASAWGASDETEKAVWEEHSFSVSGYAATEESEFNLLLVERGICRIDDVSIVEEPEGGVGNFIPNSGFEEDTLPWRIQGTHVQSERTTGDAHSGVACLEVVATSKGDTLCNRIETDTNPSLEAGRAYKVSLWTRWLRGSSLLVVHGEFSAGLWPGTIEVNLSGNSMAASIRMTVPLDLGTPGAENGQRQELLEETGSDNLGPVIADVLHVSNPPPQPGLPVGVSARVSDSDGVARVRVLYRKDAVEPTEFESVDLLEVSADGLNGGTYAGAIPPFPAIQVAFYVESTDALGAVTRFPPEAPEKALLYRADRLQPMPLQVFLSEKGKEELTTRPLHSNALLDGTVILEDEEVYYGVGVRYRGSPWGRPALNNFRLRFRCDHRFKEALKEINLSNHDRSDGAAYFLLGRNGTVEKPVAVSDYKYIRTRLNGEDFGNPGIFDPVGRDYIAKWYGAGAARDGVVLKANGRLRFSDACGRMAFDEATLRHRGENTENYRFYWRHSMSQTRDNWQPLVDVSRILDEGETPDAEFEELYESVVDVEAFLRVLVPRVMLADEDALFWGNGHNGYLFWNPTDARWRYLTFDMGAGFVFNESPYVPPTSLVLTRDEATRRILSDPPAQRLYYGLFHEFLQGYWSEELAGPFLDALDEAAGPFARAVPPRDFIRDSRPILASLLSPFITAELRILTNNGEDFTREGPEVDLEGEAPVSMRSLQLRTNDGAPQTFVPTWSSATRWFQTLPLSTGFNHFEIFGFDHDELPVGSVSITVNHPQADFIRGDTNGDLAVNVLDAIATVLFLFQGLPLSCPDAGDFDDSGVINVTDTIGILGYLFSHGTPPLPPFPGAGIDPTEDAMECRGG